MGLSGRFERAGWLVESNPTGNADEFENRKKREEYAKPGRIHGGPRGPFPVRRVFAGARIFSELRYSSPALF